MVLQSTAVSISVSGSGFTVTWSGSGSSTSWKIYIYNSTTAVGTYSLVTDESFSTAAATSGLRLVSYSPTGTYFYRAVVTTGGGPAANGTSQSLCAPVLYPESGAPSCSTINLTMSCLSNIFSGYGGGERGYSLQSYSGIRFYDGSYGPTNPPISMSAFLGQSAYPTISAQTFTANGTFTVPSGITSLTVFLWGAIGTDTEAGQGGNGGYVTGTLAVTPSELLAIFINAGGGAQAGGGIGGGRAAIQRAINNLDLVTAGGGGGAGGFETTGTKGGDGGGLIGENGEELNTSGIATGGTQTQAGVGGIGQSQTGGDGSGHIGGGAIGTGGSGGGGYYGGGGGGEGTDDVGGGGGGGSSYVAYLFGTVENTRGGNSTFPNGKIVLNWPGIAPTTMFLSATDNTSGTITGISTDTINGSFIDLDPSSSPWIISGTFNNVGDGDVAFYLDTNGEITVVGQLTFTGTINSTQVFSVDMSTYSATQYDTTFNGYTGKNNTFSISISVNESFLKVGGPINYYVTLS